jgi:hypothetical protein
VAWARERREPRPVAFWVAVFGAAAVGGLFLARWLPRALDRTVAPDSFPLLFTATLFVVLNLHHYAMDAVIWRTRDGHVRRMTQAI